MQDFWRLNATSVQRDRVIEQGKRIQPVLREKELQLLEEFKGNPRKQKIKKVKVIDCDFRDVNKFWKIYPKTFFGLLRQLTEAETDILTYILEKMEFSGHVSTNLFNGSYTDIQKGTGYTRPSIASAMKKLQELNAIVMVGSGLWIVNPQIMARGKAADLYNLQEKYNELWEAKNIKKGEDDKTDQGR